MVEKTLPSRTPFITRILRRPWFWGLLATPLALVGVSILLTEPLEPPSPDEALPLPAPEVEKVEVAEAKLARLDWPEGRLDGEPAKRLLLDVLVAARERLLAVEGYSATLRRQERIKGKLGEEQTIELKVRHRPFAVYMKFIEPDAGREVVYADGHYDNNVLAHPGGMSRAFLPRLKVPPTSALALAGNRHPVTDAGILNLTQKLIGFREMDLVDHEALTVLDRVTDDEGRVWLRSVHDHPNYHPDRPFQYVEVLYDPEMKLPRRISSYDWPEPGQSVGERNLAERYFYDDLRLDASLSNLDFDPANPAYEFKRF